MPEHNIIKRELSTLKRNMSKPKREVDDLDVAELEALRSSRNKRIRRTGHEVSECQPESYINTSFDPTATQEQSQVVATAAGEEGQIFVHKALNPTKQEIRLLRLLPATGDGQVRCKIYHFFLHYLPSYRALSYTWGQNDLMQQIHVDGRPFWVYQNLHNFLSTFHTIIARPSFFWIDQLCIDQSSVLEKNHQVGMMADIYKKAKDVIIWLGAETTHAQIAMQLISDTIDSSDYTIRDWLRPSRRDDPALHFGIAALQGKMGEERREICKAALIALLTNDYWDRLWIVQEVLLAPSAIVYWGHYWIHFHQLNRYSDHRRGRKREGGVDDNIEITEVEAPRRALEYLMMRYNSRHLPPTDSLYEAITILHKSKCKEPRDKLYALLSVVEKAYEIDIDYAKEVECVFLDAVDAMTRTEIFLIGRPMLPGDLSGLVWLCVQLMGQMVPERLKGVCPKIVLQFIHQLQAQLREQGINPTIDPKGTEDILREYVKKSGFSSLLATGWFVRSLKTFMDQHCHK